MKKLLVLLFLMLIGTSIYAQKSYVNVIAEPFSNYISLSGAVPSDMKKYYYPTDSVNLGDVLNMLAERGFVVEQMSCATGSSSNTYWKEAVILSKDGTTPSQTFSKGDVNIDGEVNIADVNEVISLILGIVREHPEILEQIKK